MKSSPITQYKKTGKAATSIKSDNKKKGNNSHKSPEKGKDQSEVNSSAITHNKKTKLTGTMIKGDDKKNEITLKNIHNREMGKLKCKVVQYRG